MNPQRLFRKAAIEKAASPERLDELMRVTSPLGWCALGGFGLIVLAALIWGVFGTVSIKVRGNGLLLRGSLLQVTSDAAGRVQEVLVAPGTVVKVKDELVRINQPDLELKIRQAEAELESLQQQLSTQKASVAGIIDQLESDRASLREKLSKQQELYNKGLVERGRPEETQRGLTSIRQQIEQNRLQAVVAENNVAAAQRRLVELRQQLGRSQVIRSPYAGPVSEVQVAVGDLIEPRTPLMTIEPKSGKVNAIVYIPAHEGKRITLGMTTQISPDTVRREEYGVMVGRVKSVSSYPVTLEGMLRVLRNEKLATSLAGEGAYFEVVIELFRDPTTKSGFHWSSSEGPPYSVVTGTGCTGAVSVETNRPIQYLLPWLRKMLQAR